MKHLLLLCCPIYVAGSLFFRIKKIIYRLCLVRFLQLAALSGGSIVVGGRVIVRKCVAYLDCVLVMRVAVVTFNHERFYNISIQHDIIQYITHVITHSTHFTIIMFLVAPIEPSTLL